MPGVTRSSEFADRGAQHRGLRGAGDEAVEPGGQRLRGAARHQRPDAQGVTGFGEIGVVTGGENRNRQHLSREPLAPAAAARIVWG